MNYTKTDIQKKVEQLKVSCSVEGALLIKSNRFTQSELDEFKDKFTKNGTHSYHFKHLSSTSREWTDEEIYKIIETMVNQKVFDEQDLLDKMNDIFMLSTFDNREFDKINFIKRVWSLVDWDLLTPITSSNRYFFTEFGSAPFNVNSNHNSDINFYRDNYGAVGMNELFGENFSEKYRQTYNIPNFIENFNNLWDEQHKLIIEKMTIYTSPYKNLDDIEENVVVKKVQAEAKKFYMDKTKLFKDRIEVFNKYGISENYIYSPKNNDLAKIFGIYLEQDIAKYQIVECESIIDWWLEELAEDRCKIDYTKNQYHPKIKQKNRGYKPSHKSIDRLYNYYINKILLEGVSKFKIDW